MFIHEVFFVTFIVIRVFFVVLTVHCSKTVQNIPQTLLQTLLPDNTTDTTTDTAQLSKLKTIHGLVRLDDVGLKCGTIKNARTCETT